MYSEKFIRDNVSALFLLLPVVNVAHYEPILQNQTLCKPRVQFMRVTCLHRTCSRNCPADVATLSWYRCTENLNVKSTFNIHVMTVISGLTCQFFLLLSTSIIVLGLYCRDICLIVGLVILVLRHWGIYFGALCRWPLWHLAGRGKQTTV